MQLKDYYTILELTPAATAIQIKKSFRQLALRHHPDKNPGNAVAEAMFKEIQEAYEVLSDPAKREEYNYKRWYHRSLHKTFKNDPLSPAGVLAECTRLYNYMLRTDTTRVDYDALAYHIRQLLNDTNIAILLQSADSGIAEKVIDKILASAASLPYRYIEPVSDLLQRVAAQDAVQFNKINGFLQHHRQKQYWQKYRVAVVVAVTLVLCWVIYIASR